MDYAAVGSGVGIARFSAGQVSFGATDVPMTAAQQRAARGGVVQVPVALGGETLSSNLSGIAAGLHIQQLAHATLSEITGPGGTRLLG